MYIFCTKYMKNRSIFSHQILIIDCFYFMRQLIADYQVCSVLMFISCFMPSLFVSCLNSPNSRETRAKIVLSLFDLYSFRAFIMHARSKDPSTRQTDKQLWNEQLRNVLLRFTSQLTFQLYSHLFSQGIPYTCVAVVQIIGARRQIFGFCIFIIETCFST